MHSNTFVSYNKFTPPSHRFSRILWSQFLRFISYCSWSYGKNWYSSPSFITHSTFLSVSLSSSASLSSLPSRVTQSLIPEQRAPFTTLLLGRPWLLYLPIHSYTETRYSPTPVNHLSAPKHVLFCSQQPWLPKKIRALLLPCACSSIGTSCPNNQIAVVPLHLLCLQVEMTPLETQDL